MGHYIEEQIEKIESEIDLLKHAVRDGEDVSSRFDHLKERVHEIKATASILIADKDAWVRRCNDLDQRVDKLEKEIKEHTEEIKELKEERNEDKKELKEHKKEIKQHKENIAALNERCNRFEDCFLQMSISLTQCLNGVHPHNI